MFGMEPDFHILSIGTIKYSITLLRREGNICVALTGAAGEIADAIFVIAFLDVTDVTGGGNNH
ncbi:MAG TPA: hypothetical protein DDW53_21725 [Lachnoclostridium sp.]|uniref:hypothetical protein n=1 Tax=Lacrimispora celerecrescens TaxID=29354 RepID=UPI000E7F1ABF|nr:hypothetical protein [Lacrimispora celerecrescens]HBE87404.1 hypothetical protein [Lachnoclostridium sp.]